MRRLACTAASAAMLLQPIWARWGPALQRASSTFTGPLQKPSRRVPFPRGLTLLPIPDSEATVENLATEYTQLSVSELVQLQKAIWRKMGRRNEAYEEFLLGELGASGSNPAAAAAAPLPRATSTSSPTSTPATAAATPKKSKVEKTIFDVHLAKYEAAQKIQMIRVLRSVVASLTMREAKEAIEKCPGAVAKALNKEDAEKLKAEMEKHGAEVKLV